jgi:Protein of unknown function (DUF3788)
MLENAFIGKTTQPTQKELAAELGNTNALWEQLVAGITNDCGITEQEWNSYSPKAGWALRLKRKKRNIVYLAPCHGAFRVSFVLGDKAMDVARGIKFPEKVRKIIKDAPHYPEGSGVRLEIKTAADLKAVKQLAKVKIEN